MKKVVLIIFFFAFCGISFAQNAWTIYNMSNSPMLTNTIRALAIDQNHTRWIGTDYGLVSLKDTTWQVYLTSNSDLPDNDIRAIYIDDQNNKWIGTFNGGVAMYDDSLWTIYNITNSDLPDDFIKGISVDSSGRKWFATAGGLAILDDTTWTIYDMFNALFISNNLSCVHIEKKTDKRYVGSLNGGLVINEDTAWNIFTIWNSGIQDNTILALDKDTLGNTWMGMPTGGLMAYVSGNTATTWRILVLMPCESNLWIFRITMFSSSPKKSSANPRDAWSTLQMSSRLRGRRNFRGKSKKIRV